jgi:putative endonuclease
MSATGSSGWFCYLLVCADGTLYAGITTGLERRLAAHNAGAASKYTRGRRPVRLLWAEPCADRAAASRCEAAIKALPRALKLTLGHGRPAPPRPAGRRPPRCRAGGSAGGRAPAAR